jgi:DNA-binding beta-propeller fold protein YncE
MKSVFTLLTGAVLAVSAMAQESNGLANPESLNSDGKFLYASNIGKALEPAAKDGDGFISKLSLDGKMITPSITTEKLNAPKGTAIIKGVLYVADIDRIVGINLASGKKVAEVSLADTKTSFLNDLTVKDDNTLFVSATDLGKVFEVNLKTSQVTPVADVKGANGICYDKAGKKLYTCNFIFQDMKGGEIGVITWKDQKPVYEKIGDIAGAFDGLALLDDHTLIVSDWGAIDHPAGSVEKIDLNTKTATKFDWPVINGPADFYLDAKTKRLFIPEIVTGNIVIKQL